MTDRDDAARERIRQEVIALLAQRSIDETRDRLRAAGKVITEDHEQLMAEFAAVLHKMSGFKDEIDRLVEARLRRRRW